jgi:hypothetical protein
LSIPIFDAPVEWLQTRANIQAAESVHKNPKSPSRILIINGSSRNDQTCPGEMSKTWRMVTLAKQAVEKPAVSKSISSTVTSYGPNMEQ